MSEDSIETAEQLIPKEEKPNVGNVFDDLKERISSPFIFSFIFAWIVANWRIFICIFLYDSEDLRRDNYSNYIDFIEDQLGWINSFVIPLTSAAFYCFAYPFLRDAIKVVQAWHITKTNKRLAETAKEGIVPMQEMFRLKEKYNKLTDDALRLIKNESKTILENETLTAEKIKLSADINDAKSKLRDWDHWNHWDLLIGEWKYRVDDEIESVATIRDGQFIVTQSTTGYSDTYFFRDFIGNPAKRMLAFDLIRQDNLTTIHCYTKMSSNLQTVSGLGILVNQSKKKVIFLRLDRIKP